MQLQGVITIQNVGGRGQEKTLRNKDKQIPILKGGTNEKGRFSYGGPSQSLSKGKEIRVKKTTKDDVDYIGEKQGNVLTYQICNKSERAVVIMVEEMH